MDITTKRYLFFFLVFYLIYLIEGCSKGLTQLRYPNSLELMYCIPNILYQPDPCKLLTGGHEAFCQRDFNHEYICCGTIDLFVDLISNGNKKSLKSLQQNPPRLTITQKDYQDSKYFRTNDNRFLNSIHDHYEQMKWSALNLLPTSTTNLPTDFSHKDIIDRNNHPTTKKPTPRRPITYRTFSFPPITMATRPGVKATTPVPIISIRESSKFIKENGPLISLITPGYFTPGNNSLSWSAPSTVTLIKDGRCSIIVNSGLPIQKNDLVSSLSAKGLFGHLFNFTVITSGHPQFIGNINLFESQHFVVGLLGVHRSIVTSNKLEKATDLCSSNTQLVHTPGPMPDSVSVLAKNVPGMGTVAITGALFIQDDNLKRVDFPFVWNQDLLFDSRKRIICMSDWLIPGHSVPIPVTRQLKMNAGCSRHL